MAGGVSVRDVDVSSDFVSNSMVAYGEKQKEHISQVDGL